MALQNTARSYVGIAKETTKGTPVTPTAFIPVIANTVKPEDKYGILLDKGLRGSAAETYNYIQGRGNSTFDFSGDAFADTIGWAIAGVMGTDTITGTAPYSHALTLKYSASTAADIQPVSYTITDFYSANVRAYAGIQFSDFSLKFNADGMLQYDAKATGWLSATASTPTPSFSTVLPTPVWYGTVSVGGTQVTNAMTGQIDMKRPVTPVWGISNTQNPYQVFLGALDVTGKVTFTMEADTQLTNFLTNTQPALVFNWTQGTGSTQTIIQAQLTKGAYTAAVIGRSKDFVEIEVTFNGQANTTDAATASGYSPIKWTIANAVSTAYC